jgi:N-acetylglucosamine-6-phosphate deacetylase
VTHSERISPSRRLTGLLVDPVDGARPGEIVVEAGRIAEVRRLEHADLGTRIFPGFVDVHVYHPVGLVEHGVTGYLQTTRSVDVDVGRHCLGLHLEGPFLNPEAAGAIPLDELWPVDLDLLGRWLEDGPVRLVTIAPELPRALDAVRLVAERGAVAALGHTRANVATARAAVAAGARFATHVWNAMAPLRARATGPLPELLLDERVTLGVIADGRHLHPRVEELTVRVAGPGRIALTSDLVEPPGELEDGTLLGGRAVGSELVRRMSRYGLAEAGAMASLTPARLLGLEDRGRLLPGYRADLAVLDEEFDVVETLVEGMTADA